MEFDFCNGRSQLINKQPFATIIIPTYNQEAYLGQALESLLSQTEPDWEAIVVDDGSTDHTAEIAEGYAQRDDRIRYIHKSNGGVASALNTGLKNARGEWIHWLSSDDLFEKQKLAINSLWIERHPDCNFFFSYFTLLREATGARERRGLWGPLPVPEQQILTLFYRNYVSGISICVKRSAWEEVGFFDESLYFAQDYGQWLQLLKKNKGIFIPEWMVISRNHATQGSEIFPEACYFDTAKAAIRFINQHDFTELVPWVNLSDSDSATKAVSYALEVACDRSAFLYCLGSHSGLILRVLEWVFSERCNDPKLRTLVRSRIAEMSFVEGDDDWAWMWRQLAIAVHQDTVRFSYSAIDTLQLALREYQSQKIRGGSSISTLREYLIRFEGVDADEVLPPPLKNSHKIVFLIDSLSENHHLLAAAELLAKRGCYPLLLITGEAVQAHNMQWINGVPVIQLSGFNRDAMPWLGEVDLSITLPSSARPTWLGSLSHLSLTENTSALEVEQNILTVLRRDGKQPVRPVVFLQRVHLGGGAEQVVLDIVRYLDKQRYRPVILTMFDEQPNSPLLTQGIQTFDIGQTPVGEAAEVMHQTELLPLLIRIYNRLMPSDMRRWIAFGKRLNNLKQRIAFGKRLNNLKQSEARPSSVSQHQSLSNSDLNFDFVSSMTHYNRLGVSLARKMSTFGKDVVLISVMEEAAVTAWLAQTASPFPYIASLHTFESMCMSDIYPTPSRLAAEKKLLSIACNDAEMVTFPSEGCCRDLKENFAVSRARIMALDNPVDCSIIRRLSFKKMKAVEEWRSKHDIFRMVHVGRLDSQKNHDLLLSVCSELKKREREFSLIIVGEGNYRQNIENRIRILGLESQVTLVGEQTNPFPWVKAADVLLLTSLFESFSLVLVESMACGTPVISVDCPTGPAEVLGEGEFGILTPLDDSSAFVDAVERLMDNPLLAREMSRLGYERAQVFDVKKVVLQWETLIDATS